MRAFLALAARWERVERWNILGGVGGRLVWFGEIGRFVVLWYCGFAVEREREDWFVNRWWFG